MPFDGCFHPKCLTVPRIKTFFFFHCSMKLPYHSTESLTMTTIHVQHTSNVAQQQLELKACHVTKCQKAHLSEVWATERCNIQWQTVINSIQWGNKKSNAQYGLDQRDMHDWCYCLCTLSNQMSYRGTMVYVACQNNLRSLCKTETSMWPYMVLTSVYCTDTSSLPDDFFVRVALRPYLCISPVCLL